MGAKTRSSLAAVALVSGAVAGCGSSSKTIAKADFIKRADAICAASNQQTNVIPFPNVDPTKATKAQLPQIAAALNKLSAAQRAEAAKLKALPDPDRDAALFHRALAGFEQQIAQVATAGQAASSGNASAFHAAARTLNSPPPGAAQARANAKQFGLKVCGARGG
jgi:hypothetical protein